jgi:hypothetical protein
MKHLAIILLLFSELSFAEQISTISPKFLQAEVQNAHTKYLKGDHQHRKEVMLSLSKLLESIDGKTRNKLIGPNTLAVTYIRIGIVEKELNNIDLASHYFHQGLATYQLVDRKMTMEKLVESTYQLDNYARQFVN